MKEIFKFKQFDVNQHGCTMKINTDGVLLAVKALGVKADGVKTEKSSDINTANEIGAQINSQEKKYNELDSYTSLEIVRQVDRILDIGTGTGVIGLILAQRFPEAKVEAIDIDEGAFNCARLNFDNSPFSDRLSIHHTGIEDFESENHFDLIVSNPPFFINSLKNTNDRKTLSRHASIAFYEALFEKCHDLLTAEGSFQIIWPLEIRDQILHVGISKKLYLSEEIHISSFPDSNAFRVISVFKKHASDAYKNEKFHIYQEQGVYSESYLELLRPFFIKIA